MVSDDEGSSRRALLSGAGAALVGAGALALSGCGREAKAGQKSVKTAKPLVQHSDVAILAGLLELERRTIAAYTAGIPLLTRPDARTAKQFLNEELQHAGELISLIKAAGGGRGPPRAASYDLGHPTDDAGRPGAAALARERPDRLLPRRDPAAAAGAGPRGDRIDSRQRRPAHLDPSARPGDEPGAVGVRQRPRVTTMSRSPTRRELLISGAGAATAATLLHAGPALAAMGPQVTRPGAAGGARESEGMRVHRLLSVELLMLYTYDQILGSSILPAPAQRPRWRRCAPRRRLTYAR